ncbi:tyrosine-type recombinase/integrase [Pararhizobium sp. BT-229]|uniref:tyrosine-type recombinase/integrase n=1 Tax=Pararhizobium sp. BT-229 TaxID=2986923 RepID=UPI0035593388
MAVWCEQAGIPPGYTLHGLRTTFANEIAEGGADPFAVQKALGHRNFRTTQIYLKKLDATPMAIRAADAAARRAAQIRRIRNSEK